MYTHNVKIQNDNEAELFDEIAERLVLKYNDLQEKFTQDLLVIVTEDVNPNDLVFRAL